jgi:hypothetical protein
MARKIASAAVRTPAGLLQFSAGAAINLSGAALLLWHAVDYVRQLVP